MKGVNNLNDVKRKIRLFSWLVLTLIMAYGCLFQNVAGSISYAITLQPIIQISTPLVRLQNGTDNISFIYTNSTSAKISINATATSTTYDYALEILNDASYAWNVTLEAYEYSFVGHVFNATIILHDTATSETQIIIENGAITQSSGSEYDLPVSSTIYVKVANITESTDGASYINAYLKLRKPNTTTYILYIITFQFT
jgi:hypothetical protein